MGTRLLSLSKQLRRSLKDSTWISNPRVLWGIFLMSVVPFFLVGSYTIHANRGVKRLEVEVARLERKSKPLMQMKKQRDKMIEEIGGVGEGYIQKYLESLMFLESDVSVLTQIHKCSDYKPIHERLTFLTNGENKMRYRKVASRKKGRIQETAWVLDHPVEINIFDFQRVMFAISEAKSRLAIKKCHLTKKNHLYTLDLELLERSVDENEI